MKKAFLFIIVSLFGVLGMTALAYSPVSSTAPPGVEVVASPAWLGMQSTQPQVNVDAVYVGQNLFQPAFVAGKVGQSYARSGVAYTPTILNPRSTYSFYKLE
jgi:hypothetical protein